MAFLQAGFYKSSVGFAEGAAPNYFGFESADAKAVVKASGYFNDAFPALSAGDLILSKMSDDTELLRVDSINPVVTSDLVAGTSIPDGGVTTAKIADGAVTDPKIAGMNGAKLVAASVATAAMTNQTKFGGNLIKLVNTSSAAITASVTTQTLTIAGVDATDTAIAQFSGAAGSAASCTAAVCAAGSVTVHYSVTTGATPTGNVLVLVIRPTGE